MTNSLGQHAEELKKKATDIGHNVQDMGRISKEIASDTVSMLGKNAETYYKDGVQKAKSWEKTLEQKIAESPMRSIAIAAGVGLIVGALWCRK